MALLMSLPLKFHNKAHRDNIMKSKDDTMNKLSECLHIIADIISNGTPNEVISVLEKALRMAKEELLLENQNIQYRSQEKSKIGNTVPAQESLALQENSSSLSIKEFGRDVTSDTEFPTRNDLVNLAMSRGVQVSKRDSKAAIRKRLLSHAELRNMDELIGKGNE